MHDDLLTFLIQKPELEPGLLPKVEEAFRKNVAECFFSVDADVQRCGNNAYWLKGGRGSTKSSFISMEIIKRLLQDRNASAIVFRKVANTLRTSVYAQMVWAIYTLNVQHLFQFSKSPLEIILKQTGQKIMFWGADDPNKTKSIKLEKGYFKFLWLEELTEFDGMADVRTIQASVLRGGDLAFTFASYNPPRSANNWVNAEVLIPAPGRMVHHSDYTMVPKKWLGPTFLAIAETLKATNEKAYQNVYLGEITGTGGQVFENLLIKAIPDELLSSFDRFHNGGDFGFAVDPDAVVRMHFSPMLRTLYFTGEIYGAKTSIFTLAEKLKALIGTEYITYDFNESRTIDELRGYGINVLKAKKGGGSIEHGIRWVQELACIQIDPFRCPNAAREYSRYEYPQDRFGNFLSSFPDKDNHTIDAGRYGVEPLSTAQVMKTVPKARFGF